MWPWTTKPVIRVNFSKLRFIHHLKAELFWICYERTIFGWDTTIWISGIWRLRVQKNLNIEKIIFKVVQIKFLAMHITNQKYVLLAIATNIPQRLKTAFVLQGHILDLKVLDFSCYNNVMYCQLWWPILEIGPLHLTHPSAHTHPEQWAAIASAPREQLGVRCLAQGRGIEGGESAVYSQSPLSIPAGPEIRTHNLWITSPTL